MKTIKQLLRQPIKTVVGIIIVALAFAILVTCVGQYTATDLTRENLNEKYDTVALISDEYFWENLEIGRHYHSELPEDIQNWVDSTIQNWTDLVKMESLTELYSAYIPGVSPDNFSQHENGDWMTDDPSIGSGNPYRCAVLEVTITKVGSVITEKVINYGVEEHRESISILCVGTVEQVVGLEQGFDSPVGNTIALTISVYSEDELDAMALEVGQRYLVYGMDYSDVQGGALESRIWLSSAQYEELFGPGQMGLNGIEYDSIVEQIGCYMTVCDYASLPAIYPDSGSFVVRKDLREQKFWDGDVIYTLYVAAEEYTPNYCVPTIIKLTDTAENYIASDEGILWRQVLEEMEINNHGFPVLAVDKLGYQVAFARSEARIVEGRDFTEMERTMGSNVCVVSESVATINGLSVGDTINLQTYAYDPNIEVQYRDVLGSTNFPSAAVYSRALGFTSDTETYTIVGIYRHNNAWQNQMDPYGFTPNTIFVPKGSVSGDARTGTRGIFYTLALHNGKMDEFKTLMTDAGYPNLFICYDQGYSEFMASLDAYEEVSEKALYIGLAAFVAIILLFLFLYPAQQKRALILMGTLGASAWGRFSHTFVSILCVLVPGAALGGYVGSKLWTRIAAALMEWINIEIALTSDMTAIAPKLTAASLAVVAFAAVIVSAALCRNRGLMKRK